MMSQGHSPLAHVNSLEILVAEDNVVNQKVLRHLLDRLGYQPTFVTKGVELLEAMNHQQYDVVLIELQLSATDDTAIRQLYQQWDLSNRPQIIAMLDQHNDRQTCLSSGIDTCISKPIRLEELTQALNQCKALKADKLKAGNLKANQWLPSTFPPLDLEALQAIRALASDDDPDLFTEIVATYLSDASALLETIQQAIADGDATQLKVSAHTFKSISAALGATTLAEYCQQLETLGQSDKLDRAAEWLPQLENEFERVRLALEADCWREL